MSLRKIFSNMSSVIKAVPSGKLQIFLECLLEPLLMRLAESPPEDTSVQQFALAGLQMALHVPDPPQAVMMILYESLTKILRAVPCCVQVSRIQEPYHLLPKELGGDSYRNGLVVCLFIILMGRWTNNSSYYSFVYTSGHCRRWRSRMEVQIMAGSLFVHCKIAYFYSVTAEKWLIVSLPNFVTMRRTHFSISCKIFSWIRSTKLKIHAMEFCDFIKDSVSPSGLFVPCSLTVTSTWRPRLTAHCPIGERH